MESIEIAKKCASLLDAKKAMNINIIGIEEISTLADYFVIATGTSNTHVKALSDELEEKLKALDVRPDHIEGYRGDTWVVLDYLSVVVHIFTKETRDFYDLDRLWSDGRRIEFK